MVGASRTLKVEDMKLLRKIGSGGMADVFRAVRRSGGPGIALKVLHAHLHEDQEMTARFEYEARKIASLRHRYIVAVRDFDIVDGQPCIAMDLVLGPSLGEHLGKLHRSRRRLALASINSLLSNVADALDYAHAAGIVHQDLKPSNILLRSETKRIVPGRDLPDDTEAVLADFGLASMLAASSALSDSGLVGTPAYLAPEQVLGGHIDARTDIYALGVILYEMLSGHVPFGDASGNPISVLLMHVHGEVPPVDGVSSPVWDVLNRALAKQQEDRYLTAGEMVRDLKHAVRGGRLERKTIRRMAGKAARP